MFRTGDVPLQSVGTNSAVESRPMKQLCLCPLWPEAGPSHLRRVRHSLSTTSEGRPLARCREGYLAYKKQPPPL